MRHRSAESPAVAVSGYGEPDLRERFDGLDIRVILRKPFTLPDLGSKLEAWLSPQRSAQASV